jgi:hypothetical protein
MADRDTPAKIIIFGPAIAATRLKNIIYYLSITAAVFIVRQMQISNALVCFTL